MQNCVTNPVPPFIFNVEGGVMHRLLFYSILNSERVRGVKGALWIKLMPVDVQVPQHFWSGL